MWIRSQNLYVIVNCETFFVKQCEKEKFDVIGDKSGRNILLGEYSTEEKALKVLDEIQKEIFYLDAHGMTTNTGTWKTNYVYQMPQDDEVGL